MDCATNLMKHYGSAVGAPAHLFELYARRQLKYLRGFNAVRGAFGQNNGRISRPKSCSLNAMPMLSSQRKIVNGSMHLRWVAGCCDGAW